MLVLEELASHTEGTYNLDINGCLLFIFSEVSPSVVCPFFMKISLPIKHLFIYYVVISGSAKQTYVQHLTGELQHFWKETILPGKLLDGTDLEVVVAVDKIAATAVELVKVFSRLMPTTCGLISVLEGAGAEPAKFVILQSKK